MNISSNTVAKIKAFTGRAGNIVNWQGMQLAGLVVVLGIMIVVSSMVSPFFLTPFNITIMIRELAFVGIIGIAQGLLLINGDIDISIGSIAGLGAVIFGTLMVRMGLDPNIALVLALASGALLGAFNGFLITFFSISALVLTIGTQVAYRGLATAVSEGRTISGFPSDLLPLGQGVWYGIPVPTMFLIGVFVFAWVLTKKTTFGRKMYAIGNSPEAAQLVGIRTSRMRVTTYAISGTLAALAGILMSLRIASAQVSIGQIWLLPSIAAPVIGGIAITGGIGTITGALVGAAIMGVIANIVVLGGVSLYWQQTINGTVVVIAIIFDSIARRFRK